MKKLIPVVGVELSVEVAKFLLLEASADGSELSEPTIFI